VLAGIFVLAAAVVDAETPDHLECYRVRDSLARTTYRADLAGLAPEPGCVVRTPARLLCVATPKTLVTPPPPGGVEGVPAGRFLCYRVRCPRNAVVPLGVRDQFGTRDVRPRPASTLLCAPLATTTTTIAPSTTTATTTIAATLTTTTTSTTARRPASTTSTVRATTSTTASLPPPTTTTTTAPPPTTTSTTTTLVPETTTLAPETTTTTTLE